jgi:hypothetical protein
MSKPKGTISKKVEQKVKEYFAKINDNIKQCDVCDRADSDKPQANK